jgi:1-acyl-sn-glycerol-3-phosphate acyltransferase
VAYWALKVVLSPLFFVLWRVRVEGRHHVPRRGPAILAANHQSFADSFFLPLVVTRKVTFLAKAEYFDSPKTAWFFRAAGQIPIRRGGGSVSERALETAREVLAAGRLLGVYPEGTRSLDDQVHRGRTGVARLAIEMGAPVIPVGIVGTKEVQPTGSNMMRPFRPVTLRFGEPLDPSAYRARLHHGEESERQVLRGFTDELMGRIAQLSGRRYVDEYVPPRRPPAEEPTTGSQSSRNLDVTVNE